MFNTPPVFSLFVVNETLKWLENIGGIETIEKINNNKAKKLYNEIDINEYFKCPVNFEDRSNMNVPFAFKNDKAIWAKFPRCTGLSVPRHVWLGFRSWLSNL